MNRFKKATVFVAGVLISITLYSTTASAADYTILQNDSLHKIGILFNTPVSTLKSDNDLNSDMIYPGQVLDIPAKLHTIKSGDTLFLIAKDYGIALSSLRKANNKWDDLLIPGQKLILPGIQLTSASKETSTTSKAVISYTQKEVDLLARLITAEASCESYNAMVAVGGVVVNRVQSKEWPNTITTVINHVSGGYYQFTPIKNGMINHAPTDAAVKAAKAAIFGSDPSNGAMFYFDDSSKNEWLWSKPVAARIGSLVFVN